MSFYVAIVDEDGNFKKVPKHWEGGTFCIDGNEDAELNITYNYSSIYREEFGGDGLWDLDGKPVREMLDQFYFVVKNLGTDRYTGPFYRLNIDFLIDGKIPVEYKERFELLDSNGVLYGKENEEFIKEGLKNKWINDGSGYWKTTRGNAGYALSIVLQWALLHQDGFFKVYE